MTAEELGMVRLLGQFRSVEIRALGDPMPPERRGVYRSPIGDSKKRERSRGILRLCLDSGYPANSKLPAHLGTVFCGYPDTEAIC